MFDEDEDEVVEEGPLSLALNEPEVIEAPALSPLRSSPQEALALLLKRESESAEREKTLFNEELARIESAKKRLLGKPTQLTGREKLDAILEAMSSRKADPKDPRFFEKQNVFTMLRDVGRAGSSMRETERSRLEEQQKQLDELEALKGRYLLPRAQAELKDIRGRIPAASREVTRQEAEAAKASKPAQLQGVARQIVELQSIVSGDGYTAEQQAAALRQLKSIGEKVRPEDRSTLGQIVQANEWLNSDDSKKVEAAQEFFRRTNTKPLSLTVSQLQKDAEIEAAKKFMETISEEELNKALKSPRISRSARDELIIKMHELSLKPPFSSAVTKPESDGLTDEERTELEQLRKEVGRS